MFKPSRMAVVSAAVVSAGFIGCNDTFGPAGTWTINYSHIESFANYTGHPATQATVTAEDYLGMPVPPLATGIAVTYDATTNTAVVDGTVLALDANHSAVISEMEMPMIAPGCLVTQYERATFDFNDADGHTAVYRQEEGVRFEGANCSTLLAGLEAGILMGGPIPSELAPMIATGGLTLILLDEVTSTGFAAIATGERVSAAEGTNHQEFAFSISGQSLAELRGLREHFATSLTLAQALGGTDRGI
jgi:hypothetical protein